MTLLAWNAAVTLCRQRKAHLVVQGALRLSVQPRLQPKRRLGFIQVHTLTSCVGVALNYLANKSPRLDCLTGRESWRTCTNGEFLCLGRAFVA
eukprot:583849-Hanusia_phi.AAC.1